MKTEIGLPPLADHVGFDPRLDCSGDEPPPELREHHRRLGVAAVPDR